MRITLLQRALAVIIGTGLFALAACDTASSSSPQSKGPSTAPSLVPVGSDGKVHLTDVEWRAKLTGDQYHILREKGTEPPFENAYWNNHAAGQYRCAACGQVLFSSTQKFDSGCGWPSFSEAADTGAVLQIPDADGQRTEVECSRCLGHLGHVFDDGPPPTGKRYCIDSAAVLFVPDAKPTTAPSAK